MNYPLLIPTGTSVVCTFNPKEPDGEPAELDGMPSISMESGGEFVSLSVMEDGSFTLGGVAEGEAVVLVSGDVRMGDGVRILEERILVTVSDEASTFGLEFSLPVVPE